MLKIVKAVVDRIVEVTDEAGPFGGKRLSLADDFFHLLVFDVMSADMNPVETHAFHDCIHPGGSQDSGAFSLVGVIAFPVQVGQEFVRDHRAGQVVAVHHFSRAERQDIDVPNEGNVEIVLLHEEQDFMEFPGIITQLRDDELRTGLDFLFQFVILAHLLRFGRLEGRNHGAGEKVAGLKAGGAFEAGHFQPAVHVGNQLEDMDGVQVKNRSRSSLIARYRVVAAHHQQVADVRPVQRIELAFDLIAVLIFAGEMNEGFDAELQDFGAHEVGGHGRGSARIVRERQGGNLPAGRDLCRLDHSPLLSGFSGAPSRHQLPGDREDGWIQ